MPTVACQAGCVIWSLAIMTSPLAPKCTYWQFWLCLVFWPFFISSRHVCPFTWHEEGRMPSLTRGTERRMRESKLSLNLWDTSRTTTLPAHKSLHVFSVGAYPLLSLPNKIILNPCLTIIYSFHLPFRNKAQKWNHYVKITSVNRLGNLAMLNIVKLGLGTRLYTKKSISKSCCSYPVMSPFDF